MISFQNFSFRYEESKDFTLRGIDMTVQTGEFILLTGRSGCGKTTLIRSLNGLIPHFYPGEIQGDLLMDGHSLLEMKPSELAGQLGTVFQDPRSQFFMTDTTRELAFGCENLGLPRKETIDRIAKAAKELELVDYLNRSIFALSSGEKQQIAIGSVYALVPKVYIFDEPSANLDYAATKRLAEIMGKLKHAGYTIFVVEHRFYYLRDLIDRAFLIQNGKIEHEFTREQFCSLPEETRISYAFHGKDDTITYDHVSFGYQNTQPGPDGKPVVTMDEVLHDISFTAKAGQKTALVGESGSGKSTLAKLLIHYYDPQKGSISIGRQKLCDMSLEALNSRISYVAQDQYLFNTSLLENIRLGRLNATDEEVVEAAKKAQCMEFLEKLPQGIHSMAGDAGKMLSGGQRQRISLARAILKDDPIVVLDEATAYADPENEEKMEAAIAELVKGKTLVVIAHKLPAIINADQICVMDHGKLVATGKHQELIQSCPEYQKLWKAAQDSAEWKVHTAKEGK